MVGWSHLRKCFVRCHQCQERVIIHVQFKIQHLKSPKVEVTTRLGLSKRKHRLTPSRPRSVNTKDASSCGGRVFTCYQFRLLPLRWRLELNPKTPSDQQKQRRRGGQELTNPPREAPIGTDQRNGWDWRQSVRSGQGVRAPNRPAPRHASHSIRPGTSPHPLSAARPRLFA